MSEPRPPNPPNPPSPEAPIEAAPAAPDGLAHQREAVHQRVMRLFRHTAGEPGSEALLHAVIRFRQEQCR